MTQAAPVLQSPSQRSTPAPQRTKFRRLKWASAVVPALVLAYIGVIAMKWPFTEQAVIRALQERSLRTVTVGHFHRTYFPPGCTAEDIRFLHRKRQEMQPLITVQKLVLVTSYSRILTLQNRLSLVRVMNMHVSVPPGQPGQPNPVMPLTYSKSGSAIRIDTLIADGAILDFLSKQAKQPYRLIIDKLRLDGVGNNVPMSYRVLLSNQLLPGKIRSTGVFGSWNPKDPGSAPLHGTYAFQDGNLAVLGGVSGTLSSSGDFNGTLREINVRGTVNVPKFKVHNTSRERQLAVSYRATVDGTNGDTTLNEVTARFDHTTAGFKGTVAKGGNLDGKTASLDMWTDSGRVEDVLWMFISEKTAPMSGAFSFAGHVELPPGPEPFLRRLRMNANFGVSGGKFANQTTESGLTRLSNSSPKSHESPAEQPMGGVVSDLKGHGTAVNGTATLSNISFSIPGAKAKLDGTYGLIDHKLDLHGTLLTTANPSNATTGFKSLLVKAITPAFKRKQAVKLVPFKITGSYSNVNTSLDLGRLK